MWVVRQSRIWASSCVFYLLFAAHPAMAGSDVRIEIVNASGSLHSEDGLTLRISGTLPANAELHVYGLANPSSDRDYARNRTVALTVVRGSQLSKPSIAIPRSSDLLEVMAILTTSDGSPVSAPSRLSLLGTRSAQAAPTTLQRLLNGASGFLDRLLGLYDSVRAGPADPRVLFLATLEPGKSAVVETLRLDRAQYRAVALSADGNRIAWVVEEPEGYQLRTATLSSLEPVRLAASNGEIVSPAFADQDVLLYVSGAELFVANLSGGSAPRPLKTPFRAVSRLYRAQRDGSSILAVVRAQHADTAGIDLPYLVKISGDERTIEAIPLADNPFYESYSQFVEGAPFFMAGTVEGVEGIYALRPDDSGGQPMPVYKIQSPGLLALSANGKKLVFAGSP